MSSVHQLGPGEQYEDVADNGRKEFQHMPEVLKTFHGRHNSVIWKLGMPGLINF